jgi:hypothetical protein
MTRSKKPDDGIAEGIAENLKAGVRSVVVKYRDMTFVIPRPELEAAVALISTRHSPHVSLTFRAKLTDALTTQYDKIASSARAPSQKRMDGFISAIMLWFAIEVVEGRASLDTH